MAENLIELAGRAIPDAKFIIWAHNGHIRVSDDPLAKPNMGSTLRDRYGPAYFGFGFEFSQDSFHTRTATPENYLADLKEVTLPPARAETLPWFLSRIHQSVFILNLRAPVDHPMVEGWLDKPQPIHSVNWAYNPAEQDYFQMHSLRKYDGIIFIERTTASRPTPNALKTIAARDGL